MARGFGRKDAGAGNHRLHLFFQQVEPARAPADLAGRDEAAERAADVAEVGFQRQDQHPPMQLRPSVARGRDQGQIGELRAAKHRFQHVRQPPARTGVQDGTERHPPHLHPHQVDDVAAGKPEPGRARRDPFQDEGEVQPAPDPRRLHVGPHRHGASLSQPVPVAAKLGHQPGRLGGVVPADRDHGRAVLDLAGQVLAVFVRHEATVVFATGQVNAILRLRLRFAKPVSSHIVKWGA